MDEALVKEIAMLDRRIIAGYRRERRLFIVALLFACWAAVVTATLVLR